MSGLSAHYSHLRLLPRILNLKFQLPSHSFFLCAENGNHFWTTSWAGQLVWMNISVEVGVAIDGDPDTECVFAKIEFDWFVDGKFMDSFANKFILAFIADELYFFRCDKVFFEGKFVGDLAFSNLLASSIELLKSHYKFMLIVCILLRERVVLWYFRWFSLMLALLICVFFIASFLLLIDWLSIRFRLFRDYLPIGYWFLHIYYCLFLLLSLLVLFLLLILSDLFLLLFYFLRKPIIDQNYIDFPMVFEILVEALINIVKQYYPSPSTKRVSVISQYRTC